MSNYFVKQEMWDERKKNVNQDNLQKQVSTGLLQRNKSRLFDHKFFERLVVFFLSLDQTSFSRDFKRKTKNKLFVKKTF
jgi:hypothetical protein